MRGNLLYRVVLLLLLLGVAGCNAASTTPAEQGAADSGITVGEQRFARNGDGYADITVEELATLLAGEAPTLINVHVPDAGEIPGTDQHLPFDQITEFTNQLPDKDRPIILYCQSGGMSTSAAKQLAAMGYSMVLEVDGGMRAWKAAGYELQPR